MASCFASARFYVHALTLIPFIFMLLSYNNVVLRTISSMNENDDMIESSITLYVYKSSFTDLYESIYHSVTIPNQLNTFTFQHYADYRFWYQLFQLTKINNTRINIARNINELDTFRISKGIIFVVPVWNDILAGMVVQQRNNYFKKALRTTNYSYRTFEHLVDDIANELTQQISLFENYTTSSGIDSYKYMTIFHGYFIDRLWNKIVKPIYVEKEMFIIHYETKRYEARWGKGELYGYKRIIIAPYMTPSKLILTDDYDYVVNDVYFSGGIRLGMAGAPLRVRACKLNQIKGFNINYLHFNDELVTNETKKVKECLVDNNAYKKHENGIFNDSIYLNDLKHSRFCLFLRGDTYSARRFYDIINANCVPIIVSDKWLERAAPFKFMIDYDKMAYFIKEKAFMIDPIYEIKKILNDLEWEMKLDYIKQNKHHLLWYKEESTVTRNIFLSLFQ